MAHTSLRLLRLRWNAGLITAEPRMNRTNPNPQISAVLQTQVSILPRVLTLGIKRRRPAQSILIGVSVCTSQTPTHLTKDVVKTTMTRRSSVASISERRTFGTPGADEHSRRRTVNWALRMAFVANAVQDQSSSPRRNFQVRQSCTAQSNDRLLNLAFHVLLLGFLQNDIISRSFSRPLNTNSLNVDDIYIPYSRIALFDLLLRRFEFASWSRCFMRVITLIW